MKRVARIAVCCLLCVPFVASCAMLLQSEREAIFERLSGITFLSDESEDHLELDAQPKFGVYRAVVPVTPAEANSITSTIEKEHWKTGEMPGDLWKSTIMMGTDKTIPEQFIPTYTNSLRYCSSDESGSRRTYVLDIKKGKPVLYFVHIQW